MSKINSRAKGCRGERLWRDELRAQGYEARRGQQFCGAAGNADVECDELSWLHCEVKFVEKLNIRDAMIQAISDASKGGRMPIVAHKTNNAPWLVTMRSEDFFRLVRASDEEMGNAIARLSEVTP